MVDLGTLLATLGVDSTSLRKAEKDMVRFEKQTNKTVAKVNKQLKSAGNQMKQFGKTATKNLTLPLAAAGVASVKLFSDFESSLAKVNGLVGVAQKQVDEWGTDILELAPKLGKAPAALADGLFFVTSAGIKGAEAMDVLEVSAKASAAGLGEVKVVADLVTSAMNAYGKENLNAQMATDVLVSAVREGKAEASALAASLGSVLPIASQMGVTFDQVGASVAAMTRTGTDAATASTQLRQILNSLLKPTEQAEEALGNMSTSSAQLRKTIKEDGLLSALMEVNKLTKTYGEETVATVFPNIRALSGVLDIMGNNLEDNVKVFNNMKDSSGALNKAYESAAKTVKFKLNVALTEGKTALTVLGKVISASALPLIESLSGGVASLTKWFASLSETSQKIIVTIGAVLAVIGPLSVALGFLATSVLPGLIMIGAKAIIMFKALRVAMISSPIGALIAVLGLAAGAFLLFRDGAEGAAKAQKQLNTAVVEGQELLASTKTIEDRVNSLASLNKRQLEGFENTIKNQIKAEEDFTVNLKQELRKRIKEDEAAGKLRKRITELGASFEEEKIKAGLSNQLQLRKKALAEDLNTEFLTNQKRIKQLTTHLKTVQNKIKTMAPEGGGAPDNAGQIAKILDEVAIKEAVIQNLTQALGATYDATTEKASLYTAAIEQLVTAGIDPASVSVQSLANKLTSLIDIKNTSLEAFQNMGMKLTQINLASQALGSTYDVTGAKLSLFNSILEKGAEDGKLTTEQLQKLKAEVTALSLLQITTGVGDQIAWIGFQAETTGKKFDANAAKIDVYKNALKALWEEGFRPGDAAFDNMQTNLNGLASSVTTTVSLTDQMDAFASSFRNIGQAMDASSNSWIMWTANLLGAIPSIIAGISALTATQGVQTAVAGTNAVANATASGAKLPFPLNIAAIAAGVGAVVAALSSVPKMAEGGIIPGGFPNDSFPAMLQSGEAVIPLDRLDNMMNNGGGGGKGRPSELRLRGRTLVAALDANAKYTKIK